jgi:anti-sigma B factor antagonist
MSDDAPPPQFITSLDASGDRAILRVVGEVDLGSSGELETALKQAAAAAARMLVDLTGVEFMDSSGLRLLLQARRDAEQDDRAFALAVAEGGAVARLLDLAGVANLFERDESPPLQG